MLARAARAAAIVDRGASIDLVLLDDGAKALARVLGPGSGHHSIPFGEDVELSVRTGVTGPAG